MAQWFKKLLRKLFAPKHKAQMMLTYNAESLKIQLGQLQNALFENYHEPTMRLVMEALSVALNVQVLTANSYMSGDDAHKMGISIGKHQGRVQAFSDFADYLRRSIDKDDHTQRTRGKEPSGTKNLSDIRKYRRPSNQAGPAIS